MKWTLLKMCLYFDECSIVVDPWVDKTFINDIGNESLG
jgi:hypothetical protein